VSCRAENKVRVLLAQALFGNPTALLSLTNQTNNLDLDSVHWLKEYLCEYTGVLIVISHDRHFLNNVCTHTADIDYQTIIMYVGGYDDHGDGQDSDRSRIEADNAVREKKIAPVERFYRALFGRYAFRGRRLRVRKKVERLCRRPNSRARTFSAPTSLLI